MNDERKCRNGHTVTGEARFCGECGTSLDETTSFLRADSEGSPAVAATSTPKSPSFFGLRPVTIFGTIGLLVVGIAIAIAVFWQNDPWLASSDQAYEDRWSEFEETICQGEFTADDATTSCVSAGVAITLTQYSSNEKIQNQEDFIEFNCERRAKAGGANFITNENNEFGIYTVWSDEYFPTTLLDRFPEGVEFYDCTMS